MCLLLIFIFKIFYTYENFFIEMYSHISIIFDIYKFCYIIQYKFNRSYNREIKKWCMVIYKYFPKIYS